MFNSGWRICGLQGLPRASPATAQRASSREKVSLQLILVRCAVVQCNTAAVVVYTTVIVACCVQNMIIQLKLLLTACLLFVSMHICVS